MLVDDLYYSYNSKKSGNIFCNYNLIDAPTLAQAQKWLRKEKNVFICPLPHTKFEENSEGEYEIVSYDMWYYDLWINGKDESPLKSNEFSTPEEALSAGITECLKLIEKDN